MANTISLNSGHTQLVFNDGTDHDISLSGNGVNLSLRNGEIQAVAAPSAPSGDTVTYSLTTNPNINVQYPSSSESDAVEFIGVVDTGVQRNFSVANNNIVNVY